MVVLDDTTPEAPAKRARIDSAPRPLKQTSLLGMFKSRSTAAVPSTESEAKSCKEATPAALTSQGAGPAPSAVVGAVESPSAPQAAGSAASAQESQDAALLRSNWLPLLGLGWFKALEAELRRPSFEKIIRDVQEQRAKHGSRVFPPEDKVFNAFVSTPLELVRVVIVGQDPYHGRGQAMGLSFSVPRGVRPPPSLMNMLKEARVWPSVHGDLTSWAQQGVFLLNSALSVLEGQPNSHKGLGWDRFTDAAIRALSREREGVVFLLWGRDAKEKAKLVDSSRHHVLTAGHPSPLSYEKHFKGCGHFDQTNKILAAKGLPEICWQLPP